MSLMMDKDYLILSLRLAYLRRVDDHVGPRVITVPDIVNLPNRSGTGKRQNKSQHDQTHFHHRIPHQSSQKQKSSLDFDQNIPSASGSKVSSTGIGYRGNEISEEEYANSMIPPYPLDSPVVMTGLNDARKHPELTTIYSPKLTNENLRSVQEGSEDPFVAGTSELMDTYGELKEVNRARASSLGASGLKHTTTIYGPGRTGALGMRVSGRRNVSIEDRRRKALREGNEVGLGIGEEMQGAQRHRKLGPTRKRSVESSLREKTSRGRLSDQSSTSTAIDGTPSERSALSNNQSHGIPQVAIQSSSQDVDEYGESSKRSKSLRVPMNSSDATSTSLVADMNAIKLRNRSSSQPHRPGFPSNLSNVSISQSEHGIPSATSRLVQDREEIMPGSFEGLRSTMDQQTSSSGHMNTSVPKVTPPPRPARRQRTSISERSVHSASSVPISSTADESPQVIDGRQRSQSEAIMPGTMPPARPILSTVQAANRSENQNLPQEPSNTALGSASYMGRTQSESTIFSLASPHVTRQRGMSNRSLQSDGSIRSTDTSAMTDKQSLLSKPFAPVAEDSETQFYSDDKANLDSSENLQYTPDARDRVGNGDETSSAYLLSPFSVQEKGQSEFGSFLNDTERLAGRAMISSSVSTVPTSSQQVTAPISTALGIDQGYVSTSLTPGLSSTGAGSGGLEKIIGSKPSQLKSVDLNSRSPSPFTKTDPISLKKQFDKQSKRSALTSLLSNPTERPNNPFTQHYKSVAGSSVSTGNSAVVEVYFPFANKNNAVSNVSKPRSGALALNAGTRSIRLSVRKDATMEELIGYSLYCYVEEGWMPKLDDSLPPETTEEQREIRMSTVSWTLRLVEDGEVDDDYPALDRSLTIGKFGADELAVCEATPAQIKQNQSASALLERRVSRQRKQSSVLQTLQPPAIGVGSKQATLNTPRIPSSNTDKQDSSMSLLQGTPLFPKSLLGLRRDGDYSASGFGTSSSMSASQYGPPIFLRILVTPTKDVRYKTTLQVTSDRYLADVLETICKRRDLGSADKWALVVADKDIVVPLDRTVESLQGNYDLALVRRQDLGAEHSGAFTTQSTNPNTSIFKRISQPQPRYQAAAKEIASVYKSYTVNRRMPTFLGRHERILTIDGDWLHIIPTETRAFQTHTATTSYPISSIVSCTQSRLPSSFKLIVLRESDQKRYDFEAENSKIATEIVQEINALLTNLGSNSVRK